MHIAPKPACFSGLEKISLPLAGVMRVPWALIAGGLSGFGNLSETKKPIRGLVKFMPNKN